MELSCQGFNRCSVAALPDSGILRTSSIPHIVQDQGKASQRGEASHLKKDSYCSEKKGVPDMFLRSSREVTGLV